MKARITEVFDSVQGEGIYLGEPQLFVRFFGCNLHCRFCDTRPNRFSEYEPGELLDEIRLYANSFHSISFTGGEPLLQKDFLKEILSLTHDHGYKNYLETNGTLAYELKDVIHYVDIVAMDLKLPSSTGMGGLWGMHYKFLEIASCKEVFLKAIISQATTEDDLRAALGLIGSVNKAVVLVLQPNSYENHSRLNKKLKDFQNVCLENRITTCIIPQMHKMIGVK
jgi:organic radical activating enzyme